jgi:hypothetical protein
MGSWQNPTTGVSYSSSSSFLSLFLSFSSAFECTRPRLTLDFTQPRHRTTIELLLLNRTQPRS